MAKGTTTRKATTTTRKAKTASKLTLPSLPPRVKLLSKKAAVKDNLCRLFLRRVVKVRDAAIWVHMFALATASIVDWYDKSIGHATFADRLQAALDARLDAHQAKVTKEKGYGVVPRIHARGSFIAARDFLLSRARHLREEMETQIEVCGPFPKRWKWDAKAFDAAMRADLPSLKLWDDAEHPYMLVRYTEDLVINGHYLVSALWHCKHQREDGETLAGEKYLHEFAGVDDDE
jgi:hypothetical protein